MKIIALLVIVGILTLSLSACFAPRPLRRLPAPVIVKPHVKPPLVRP